MTQTCNIRDGIRIKFLRSGVEVIPYEASIQNGMNKHAYARAKLSRRAGDLVDDSALRHEPVEVRIGGLVQGRYMYPKDGITLGTDQAWVQLDAAGTIFQHGLMGGRYEETTLEDVANDIHEAVNDRYGVIKGVKIETPDLAQATESQTTRTDRLLSLENTPLAHILWEGTTGGFNFPDISPLAALNEVTDTFGVGYRVDRDGYLRIGAFPFVTGTDHHHLMGKRDLDTMLLREYTVTKDASRIGRVVLNGQYLVDKGSGLQPTVYLTPLAEAWVPGSDGDEIAIEQDFETKDAGELEARAVSVLLDLLADHKFGNVVFNSGSSPEEGQTELVGMDPGDILHASDGLQEFCHKRVHGGTFGITEVQHNLNTRVGWETIAKVSFLPEQIGSMSVYYDAHLDEEFDTIETAREGKHNSTGDYRIGDES